MTNIEAIFDSMPDRVPYEEHKSRNEKIFTPGYLAREMLDALPNEVWNSKTTFLDPTCKSGVFLYEIYNRLMKSTSLIEEIPNPKDRREHIINKQLYGIAMVDTCKLISMRTVFGELRADGNIISFGANYMNIMQNEDKQFLYGYLTKEFNRMQFDVVIGNPPYNRGGT